jgi:hypothetical protein
MGAAKHGLPRGFRGLQGTPETFEAASNHGTATWFRFDLSMVHAGGSGAAGAPTLITQKALD